MNDIFVGTFAKMFEKDMCNDFADKAAATTACDARRSRKAAHVAAKQLGCACASTYDYEIPAALGTSTKIILLTQNVLEGTDGWGTPSVSSREASYALMGVGPPHQCPLGEASYATFSFY